MANSYKEYTGDGSTVTYTTPPHLQTTHLVVTVDGVSTTAYTLVGTALTFTTAPANEAVVRISRNTSQGQRLTDYSDASLLTADALDEDANQLFYMAQEAIDTASETNLAGSTFYSVTTAPSSPTVGDLWYDTAASPNTIKVYDGAVWAAIAPTGTRSYYTGVAGLGDTITVDSVIYSFISQSDFITNSTQVFLNGVKLIEGDSLGDGDYWFDASTSRLMFTAQFADTTNDTVEILNFSFTAGATGTFRDKYNNTVTVTNGLITSLS